MPQCLPDIAVMKRVLAILVGLGLGCGIAAAAVTLPKHAPLPRPRPPIPQGWAEPRSFEEAIAGLDFDPGTVTGAPTLCDERLAAMAEIELMPRLIGPGACGAGDLVEIGAVRLSDKTRVAIHPRSLLRCAMAESLAVWVRDVVAQQVATLGANLKSVETYDNYSCRSRNRRRGAKLSEHAKGNAVDVRAFTLDDGRYLALTDVTVSKDVRNVLRDTACRRFTTVLGPGDPYHGEHIHLDIIQRRNGYRLCQWEVRVPPPPVKVGEVDPSIPLPRPRPAAAGAR